MKKINTLIFLASLLLLAVLIIQLNWIFETARIKQEIFNDKANMILTRTTEVIASDENTCRGIENGISEIERKSIDSIFNYYMQLYNFKVDYVFELADKNAFQQAILSSAKNTFQQQIESSNISGDVVLRLILPDRNQYLFAELKSSLFASVLLIVLVLVLFWKTLKSLIAEKQIALNTYQYLSNMMHELKTPITNISMSLKLLNKSQSQENYLKSSEYIRIISDENEKLKQQLEQALNISALDKGIINIQKSVNDLHAIIESAIQEMNLKIKSNNVELQISFKARNPLLMADAVTLKHVFMNIIDNAIKYSDASRYLEINTYNEEDFIYLVIKDRGLGIPKKYHQNIFDAYFRVPTGDLHNVKGFGLGLSYVKKILDLHNAKIDLESIEGIGSTFRIQFKNVEK